MRLSGSHPAAFFLWGAGHYTLIIQTVRAQQEVQEAYRYDAVLIPFGHNVIPHHNDFLGLVDKIHDES